MLILACYSLDPANYRIPSTPITISLLGSPPYGIPLPRGALTSLLAAAWADCSDLSAHGDGPVPQLYALENSGLELSISMDHTKIHSRYSSLGLGLIGLRYVLLGPEGVGSVSSHFKFLWDGKGIVARGLIFRSEYMIIMANDTVDTEDLAAMA